MLKKYLPSYTSNNINDYEEFNIPIGVREETPTEPGIAMKHQNLIANFMTGYTPIDSLLLVHSMGTGKSCTAIQAIEKNIHSLMFQSKRAIILNKGKNIASNFINELVNKCTTQYNISNNERIQKSLWSKIYSFDTFELFAKKIKDMSDSELKQKYEGTFFVIDEVHNLLNEESLVYTEISRCFSVLNNKKILLLTGTPVKDSPEDFVPVINLILKNKIQQHDFKQKFYDKNGNLTHEFKNLLIDKVSYLDASIPEIKINHEGSLYLGLRQFNVVVHKMSPFQAKVYKSAYEKDTRSGGIYQHSSQAVRFVYPDGSYGNEGFLNYIIPKTYALKADFKKDLQQYGNDYNSVLKRISELSVKYAYIINSVIEADSRGEKSFVYDNFVNGSGLILFSRLLDFVGFKKYRIITAETTTTSEIKKIQKAFNNDPTGKDISVILGSKVIAEGFTLMDVLHEHLVPHWNNTETMQVMARGIRMGSHVKILAINPNAEVHVYRHISVPTNNPETSIDYIMTKLSEDKDIEISKILNAIKEASITCNQFIKRNGGSCLVKKPLLYDERHMWYGIEKYIGEREYCIDDIKRLFLSEHVMTLQDIYTRLNPIPHSVILNSLLRVVGEKMSIINNKGITTYLYNFNDLFFATDSIIINPDPTISRYSRELRPYTKGSLQNIYSEAVNIFVQDLNNNKNIQRLIELAVTIELCNLHTNNPDYQKEILSKYASSYNINKQNNFATVFYLYNIVEERAKPRCLNKPSTNQPWNEWIDCEESMIEDLIKNTKEKQELFENNIKTRGLNYYGLINPNLGEFCIKKLEQEKSAIEDKRKIASGKRCYNWNKGVLIDIAKEVGFPDAETLNDESRIYICDSLKEYFSENNMIIENTSCGVQTKKK